MACPSGHPTWPYSLLIFVESSLELMENFSRDRAEVSQSLHFALGSHSLPCNPEHVLICHLLEGMKSFPMKTVKH